MKIILSLLVLISPVWIYAQIDSIEGQATTDFSIPSSPAFSLLNINPSVVNKPGLLKDFKVDWVLKDEAMAPNIAIEANPIWLLFFRNTSLNEYQDLNWAARTAGTSNISIGTVENDSMRSLAWSIKLTLFRKDPLLDNAFMNNYLKWTNRSELEKSLENKILNLDWEINDLPDDDPSLPEKKEKLDSLEQELQDIQTLDFEKMDSLYTDWETTNWNASSLDIGFGQVFDYTEISAENLDLTQKGFGLWINPALGFGSNFLLSGLVRYVQWETSDYSIYAGANIRIGTGKFNGFGEYVAEFQENSWDQLISYGGEYRVNTMFVVEFSLRTQYDSDFSLNQLQPTFNLKYSPAKN